MRLMYSLGVSVAAAAAFTASTLAQAPTPAGQTPAPSAAAAQQGEQVTFSGCIQREADYRKAQDAGRGGVAGTGVGAANEFILVSASAAGSGGATSSTPTSPAGATGTTGTAGPGKDTAFELTGPGEGQAAQFIGRRVEISGRLKPAETGTAGRATGGPTAGAPPAGVDLASRDLALRELEVATVKAAATGTCPAQ